MEYRLLFTFCLQPTVSWEFKGQSLMHMKVKKNENQSYSGWKDGNARRKLIGMKGHDCLYVFYQYNECYIDPGISYKFLIVDLRLERILCESAPVDALQSYYSPLSPSPATVLHFVFWPCPSVSSLPGWLGVPDSNRQFPRLEHRVLCRGPHAAHNHTMLTHSQSSSNGTQATGEWTPQIRSSRLDPSGAGEHPPCPRVGDEQNVFWVAGGRMRFGCEMELRLLDNEVCACLCKCVCVF